MPITPLIIAETREAFVLVLKSIFFVRIVTCVIDNALKKSINPVALTNAVNSTRWKKSDTNGALTKRKIYNTS